MSLHQLAAIKPQWENFLRAHREWEKYNNPAGWESGQVHVYWADRTIALLELVRTEAPFRQIHRLIKARGL